MFNSPCTWCRRVHRVPGTEVFGPWNFIGSINCSKNPGRNRMRSMPETSSLVSLNHSAYSIVPCLLHQNAIFFRLLSTNILPSMQKNASFKNPNNKGHVTFVFTGFPVAPSINRRICTGTETVFFTSRGRDKNSTNALVQMFNKQSQLLLKAEKFPKKKNATLYSHTKPISLTSKLNFIHP